MTRSEIIVGVKKARAEARLAVGPHDWNDQTWSARNRAKNHALAEQLTIEFGAKIRDDWNGARVSLAGVTSTSTGGLDGAIANWIAAARRKENLS